MSVARPEPVAAESAPRLRLLPAPSGQPPYDDDPAVRRPVLRLVRDPLPAAPPPSPSSPGTLPRSATAGRTTAR